MQKIIVLLLLSTGIIGNTQANQVPSLKELAGKKIAAEIHHAIQNQDIPYIERALYLTKHEEIGEIIKEELLKLNLASLKFAFDRKHIKVPLIYEIPGKVTCTAYSTNNKMIAFGFGSTICIYDIRTAGFQNISFTDVCKKNGIAHDNLGAINSVQWNKDDNRILLSTTKGAWIVYNIAQDKCYMLNQYKQNIIHALWLENDDLIGINKKHKLITFSNIESEKSEFSETIIFHKPPKNIRFFFNGIYLVWFTTDKMYACNTIKKTVCRWNLHSDLINQDIKNVLVMPNNVLLIFFGSNLYYSNLNTKKMFSRRPLEYEPDVCPITLNNNFLVFISNTKFILYNVDKNTCNPICQSYHYFKIIGQNQKSKIFMGIFASKGKCLSCYNAMSGKLISLNLFKYNAQCTAAFCANDFSSMHTTEHLETDKTRVEVYDTALTRLLPISCTDIIVLEILALKPNILNKLEHKDLLIQSIKNLPKPLAEKFQGTIMALPLFCM